MRVVVKSDNAPAMKGLAGGVKELRTCPTVIEESPEYEPQSNRLAR